MTEVHCKGLEQQQGNNDLGERGKSDSEEQSTTQVPTVTNQVPATPQSKFLLVIVDCLYKSKL